MRFNSNGRLANEFGDGGKLVVSFGDGDDDACDITALHDGRIVLTGYCHNGKNNDFALALLESNGQLSVAQAKNPKP